MRRALPVGSLSRRQRPKHKNNPLGGLKYVLKIKWPPFRGARALAALPYVH
jgi:hypothetical protein